MNWKAVFENPARLRMRIQGVPIAYRRGTAAHVREIWQAADDEGTIQAWDMVRLFPGRPTLHTTTSLKHALALIGAEVEDWT